MLIVLFVLFLLTYDPRSRMIDNYMDFPVGGCADGRINNVQFGPDGKFKCPTPNDYKGAIITK